MPPKPALPAAYVMPVPAVQEPGHAPVSPVAAAAVQADNAPVASPTCATVFIGLPAHLYGAYARVTTGGEHVCRRCSRPVLEHSEEQGGASSPPQQGPSDVRVSGALAPPTDEAGVLFRMCDAWRMGPLSRKAR